MKPLYPFTIGLASLLLPAIAPVVIHPHLPVEITDSHPPMLQLARRRRPTLSWRVGVRSSRFHLGGSSRSASCPSQATMTAFAPPPRPEEHVAGGNGAIDYTLSSHPTFWVYMENIPKQALVQLTLQDELGQHQLYNVRFVVDGERGIAGIPLPATEPPLQVGKNYYWQMQVQCDDDTSSDGKLSIGSWLQRLSPDQIKAAPGFDPKPLVQELSQATAADKPALYAALGIWQDALTTLIALREKPPHNQEQEEDWQTLLTAAQMGEFSNAPLLKVEIKSERETK